MDSRGLDRRAALKLAAAALAGATGCAARPAADTAAGTAPSPRPSPTFGREPLRRPLPPAPSPTPALPAVARWQPSAGESLPALKSVAADFVQGACTRRPGQSVDEALGEVAALVVGGFDEAAALRQLAVLGEGTASTGAVVYPQHGGLVPLSAAATTASVMVVVRQSVLEAGGRVVPVVRTLDVRLTLADTWRVTGVASAGGQPVERPRDLSPAAVRVLDGPRIELPDTARWDVHAGRVSQQLLQLLADAAVVAPVSVAVLQTGHPREVFGTRTISAHTAGRAVDLWRIGGTPVVDDRSPGGPTVLLQAAALLHPSTSQLGSPPGTDRDGAPRRSFANLVHEDHVHLAA